MRFAVFPDEANAPFITDTDAVLSSTIAGELFELKTGTFEIMQGLRFLQKPQLAERHVLNALELSHARALE